MKYSRLRGGTNHEVRGINISPLIDMVFILLIFFIVAAVFVEEPGVQVRRPEAVTARDLEKNSILLAITADEEVYYGGDSIGIDPNRGGDVCWVSGVDSHHRDIGVVYPVSIGVSSSGSHAPC